ncbi:MarR family winged helix-turn-helix transcriptional regulator [Aeromonas sanarellii]|uniref:MarR family winged helix-turn-helix transcriptional regulator n=1 Tax=Aeromonas TaxID=642 RepID=UPI0005A6DC4D|nr:MULTISPECIES: MarR family transcriptional regulator [Aeromonas]MEB6606276.1 MarR family transcriptional regulator [Aeromonas sanarellii]QXC28883.1 MarR family transcriptional regulator [Aeromonas sp. FDAARGOS 1409]QXW30999.1 MarR family transcriptional regulator [Aeromonas sanarellii]WOX49606.1 MarR family transcriptional regulator [Aeromonas sp. XH]
MDSDHVDLLLAQWARQRPDLDCSPMGVLGRVARMAAIAGREVSEELKECGLLGSDFDILATLRRAGEPLTPTALYQSAMLSSGAMTARLDKLEQRGLITRQAAPDDRRSLLVNLTDAGLALVDEAVERHLANERRLLAPLTGEEQAQLAALLKRWLLENE